MRILFVSSGNSKEGISPIVRNQGTSLSQFGHHISFFTIKGKGVQGYLGHIFVLRKFLKERSFDVVHAHYSLSAFTAALAGAKPLVVSLMGSDVKASAGLTYVIKLFKRIFWKKVIVKSKDMQASAKLKDASVVPNGVDFNIFKPFDRERALRVTGWDPAKKHVLFAANPNRKEKNYPLAERAYRALKDGTVELHTLVDVSNKLMPAHYNAADVVLLTSFWEGSPNVIKEAMACNCKIVAVNVGDIQEVTAGTIGCFVTDFNVLEISQKLKQALAMERKTNGREKIGHLNSNKVAAQLINIYTAIT